MDILTFQSSIAIVDVNFLYMLDEAAVIVGAGSKAYVEIFDRITAMEQIVYNLLINRDQLLLYLIIKNDDASKIIHLNFMQRKIQPLKDDFS